MTAWARLLHLDQPPTQTHEMLARIADESYQPLLAVLKEHSNARLAINMNAVLTEMRRGDTSGRVKEESSWRVAAASVIRARPGTILFEDAP